MRVWNYVVLLALAASLIALIFSISGRFDAGTRRRHDICVQMNSLRKILHDEHMPKLVQAKKNVRKYPTGVTLQTDKGPLRVSHEDLVRTRNAEARIVRDTHKKACP